MTNCDSLDTNAVRILLEHEIEDLKRRLLDSDRRQDDQFHQFQSYIADTFKTIDQRIESQNGIRKSLSDQAGLMMPRTEADARLISIQNAHDERFSALQEKVEKQGKPNLPLWVSFMSVVFLAVSAVWVIIGLKIDATNQPVVVGMEQAKITGQARDRTIQDMSNEFNGYKQSQARIDAQQSKDLSNVEQDDKQSDVDRRQLNERMRIAESSISSSQSADANSRTDRKQLNDRVSNLENRMATETTERRSDSSANAQRLIEIETQFRGVETVIGLLKEQLNQSISIIWNKVFPGNPYPFPRFTPQLHQNQ